ncbi:SyrB-like regulator [Ensifer sp. NM-2]|uniref:SyrB-like regulator n=1 Tax=Ensifer sp. NM-2 TaxID=2109730 RepID=UPI000D13B9C6|nr:SyrB-like regulator [Ensifer sp. NM-2]PSS60573.1 SyrB-like regulator [Ensifer sp. NM-2]
MADENNIELTETTAPAELPPKKRRGPRPKNVASETTAEAPGANVAQPARGRRKRSEKSEDAPAPTTTKAKNTAKGAGKTQTPKPATEPPAPVFDDIADLLQLEEENARLRKALAEKLRAENADLRKRLGLA